MKPILVFLILVLTSTTASATVQTAPEEVSRSTVEILTVAMSTGFGLLNAVTTASGDPSYLSGGIAIGLGLVALTMSTPSQDPVHQTSLLVSGTFAMVSGLVALRYKHVLNSRVTHSRLEPTWNHVGPGLALIVDF
jgi:hypothetical protein